MYIYAVLGVFTTPIVKKNSSLKVLSHFHCCLQKHFIYHNYNRGGRVINRWNAPRQYVYKNRNYCCLLKLENVPPISNCTTFMKFPSSSILRYSERLISVCCAYNCIIDNAIVRNVKSFFIILYKLFVYMKNNVCRYIPIYLFVELFFIASNYIRAVFTEQIGQWQIAILISVCIEP